MCTDLKVVGRSDLLWKMCLLLEKGWKDMYTTPAQHERTAGNNHEDILNEEETVPALSEGLVTGSLENDCFDEPGK